MHVEGATCEVRNFETVSSLQANDCQARGDRATRGEGGQVSTNLDIQAVSKAIAEQLAAKQFASTRVMERRVAIEEFTPIIAAVLNDAIGKQGWQPIDSAPKDGTRIHVWWGRCVETFWVRRDDPNPKWSFEGWQPPQMIATKGQPTHWRPLPAPPKETL
jgi:hypothetical protein